MSLHSPDHHLDAQFRPLVSDFTLWRDAEVILLVITARVDNQLCAWRRNLLFIVFMVWVDAVSAEVFDVTASL